MESKQGREFYVFSPTVVNPNTRITTNLLDDKTIKTGPIQQEWLSKEPTDLDILMGVLKSHWKRNQNIQIWFLKIYSV